MKAQQMLQCKPNASFSQHAAQLLFLRSPSRTPRPSASPSSSPYRTPRPAPPAPAQSPVLHTPASAARSPARVSTCSKPRHVPLHTQGPAPSNHSSGPPRAPSLTPPCFYFKAQ
ncbi:hypothetical protein PRUPE_1G193300 [Prunus persica]|uniref:Uncharacterized protein n=1 Tax=Prunus persica TaxID=3760 RepID=A0A251QZT2_PRUPE|nr:hypothetical protein PRUPE_1G193300 [Prunus persica]